VSIDLPLAGLLSQRAPCMRAGTELLPELGGGIGRDRETVGAMQPARLADRPDEWWARACYALGDLIADGTLVDFKAGLHHRVLA
jgi:hypothetical protein